MNSVHEAGLDGMVEPSNKKLEERQVLDAVYAGRPGFAVASSESPDFIITAPFLERPVGVEIVRFYESETDARLERIPDYLGDLLDNQKYRHKEDQRCLDIREVTILEPDCDQEVARAMAVIKRCPSIKEWGGIVAALMIEKDRILRNTHGSFAHLNLVVKDRTRRLRSVPREDVCAALLTTEVMDALAQVHFREVSLVTDAGDGIGYIPLRMLHLLSEAYLFDDVIHKNDLIVDIESHGLAWRAFARHFGSAYHQEVLVRNEGAATEIICGDSGLLTHPDGDVTVRMYWDRPFPVDAIAVSQEPSLPLDTERLSGLIAEARTATRFTTSLWFPADRPPS
jgi:hypothetical protein